ncbi:hypothetical protein PHJA_000217000 [Phtheirospermum japonicum]|uniref:KIB1-4 beta-propeller domain-containing protein n=1 Tax=Phtheirospermum japonicum TaxID=374723 RepID=A0A830B115_9LAMI|nr:hypothetical protein PHJA_000217000 [Phtheirospermum japonicum]
MDMAYSILRRRYSIQSMDMAYSILRRRYSILSRISAGIANSFDSKCCNLGHRRMMSTLNPGPSRRMSPWLVLPPAFEGGGGDMVYRFYNLAEDRVESVRKRKPESESESELPDDECEFVGSSHGWLALFNPRNNDLFLSNPITRRHIKLPSIQTLPDPKTNLTRDGLGSVSKVILSCCPDADDAVECRAMMTFGPGDRLAFCHPRRSTEWTPIGDLYFTGYREDEWCCVMKYGRAYEDFVYCSQRKVFGCTTQLEIDLLNWCPTPPTLFEVWDLFSSEPKSRIYYWHRTHFRGENCTWLNENKAKLIKSCRQIPYLVYAEQHDQLFMVIRFVMERAVGRSSYVDVGNIPYDPVSGRLLTHLYPYKTIGFSVLKFDYGNQKTRGLQVVDGLRLMGGGNNSLDGLAMFVGMNHSFAVSGADELGLKPNSIYFTDSNKNPTLPPDSIFGGHDIGIFDYENKTISPCYYPCDVHSLRRIVPAPTWFTPTPHQ